jgi:protein involved in polysaccharide export with SLBB domain
MNKKGIFFIAMIILRTTAGGEVLEDLIRKKIDSYVPKSNYTTIKSNISYDALPNNQSQNIFPSDQDKIIGFGAQVNDSTYVLGTGDGLAIHIWGTVNTEINAVIDYEGYLIIPKVGSVYLKGVTLAEGKKLVGAKIKEHYKSVDFSIVLNEIRQFKVYIIGQVKKPGSYIINSGYRVSDLVELAEGKSDFASLRNITVHNAENQLVSKADLLLFYQGNDNSMNPFLNEGDRVFINKVNEIISIDGAVQYPGIMDYDSTDSLHKIIKLAGGLCRGADSSKIFVSRFVNDLDSLIEYKCSYYDSSVYRFKILKDDRIYVFSKPLYRIHRNVTVTGEVANPGKYPIQKNTTLKEVIQLAGGFTPDADLMRSRLIRTIDDFTGDREFSRLQKIPPEHLSPLDKAYIASRLNEESGRVSVDFYKILSDQMDDVILHDGDEIVIEKKALTVKVIGAVVNPGLVMVKDGESVEYYLNQAGGFHPRAKKSAVKVMRNGKEIWKNKRRIGILESGDVIWVPEKYYRNPYNTTKEILVTLGSIATVVISALTIKELSSE